MSNSSNAVVTLNPVDSAKALVKVLKVVFPGVKFSRRMSRGTGHGTLTLSWTDGPTAGDVEELTNTWQGKSFDGMTDSTNYTRREVATVGGDRVVSGLGYIFTSRTISDEEVEAAFEGLVSAGYRQFREGMDDHSAQYCWTHRMQTIAERGRDPEISTATSQPPKEIGILIGTLLRR